MFINLNPYVPRHFYSLYTSFGGADYYWLPVTELKLSYHKAHVIVTACKFVNSSPESGGELIQSLSPKPLNPLRSLVNF